MSTATGKKRAAKAAANIKASKAPDPIVGSGDYVWVISTMANAVSYNQHITVDGLPRIDPERSITLRGGASLPNGLSGFGELGQNESNGLPMWTPAGMATRISKERYAILKEHWLFKKHLAKGYVSVTGQDVAGNHAAIKKIVEGMETNDPCGLMNQEKFKRYAARTQGKGLKILTNKDSISMDKIDQFG
jgi:hypothetical protein